jgi:hypothetical protein
MKNTRRAKRAVQNLNKKTYWGTLKRPALFPIRKHALNQWGSAPLVLIFLIEFAKNLFKLLSIYNLININLFFWQNKKFRIKFYNSFKKENNNEKNYENFLYYFLFKKEYFQNAIKKLFGFEQNF